MNISIKKYCLVVVTIALFSANLWAQTQTLSITATSTDGTVIYANDKKAAWIDGTITVRRSNLNTNPSFTVDVAPNSDAVGGVYPRNANWRYYNTSGGNSALYINNSEIFKGSNHSTSSSIFKMWDIAGIGDANVSSNNVYTGQFPSSSLTQTYNFCAVFWQNSSLAAGTYELPITFRLRQEAFAVGDPTTDPVATVTVVLRFVVGTTAAVYFSDTLSGPEIFNLQFNEITAESPRDFYIYVQSNFRYYLNVRSANLGFLKHEKYSDPISPIPEKIGYSLKIGTTTIPLTSGNYKFSTRYNTTGFGTSSRNYKATITIGDVSEYNAGKYSDALIFSITSN